jgi:hypothetical protein
MYVGHVDGVIVFDTIVPVAVVVDAPTGVASIYTDVPLVIVISQMVGVLGVNASVAPPSMTFPEWKFSLPAVESALKHRSDSTLVK